ncbi:MAG: hypothetical protein PUF61_07470 [Spirochaetales bacterium]|nr:hypothetical protein [Spirochaetales bacterium]
MAWTREEKEQESHIEVIEKGEEVKKSAALAVNQITTNNSIKETEKKFEFGKYDRKKFDTNAKQKAKEAQFASGKKQFDPISGEEIVLTQEEAKRRWGDDWAKHAAEGDHIDPLERVYEKGKEKAFVKESDVKEIANQESNITSISKETNTRKVNKTNEEFVNNPEYNYSKKGKENAAKLQKEAEKINNERLKQKNIQGAKETLYGSAQKAAINTSITTGVSSVIQNVMLVKDGKKDADDAVFDTVKDTAIATGKSVVVSTSSTLTQAAKYSKSKILKGLAKSNVITYSLQAVTEIGPDLYKASISKSISWTQLGKNFSVFAGGLAGAELGAAGGGAAGAKAGAAIGTFIEPGAGTTAGGAIGATVGTIGGGIGGGIGGAKAAKALTDAIAKDDAELMTETMNQRVAELAALYGLSSEEFEKKVLPKIQKEVDGKWLVKMFKYSGRDDIHLQKKFVDKELIKFFDESSKEKNLLKRFFISIKTVKVKIACGLPVNFLFRHFKTLLGIIVFLVLIILLLILLKTCSIETKKLQSDKEFQPGYVETIEIPNKISESIEKLKDIVLPETKSFEFRADSSDYLNNLDANEWCDTMALKIKKELIKNPNLEFIIKGYVAEFDNEINGDNLALERALKIKSELIIREVPENNLIAISGGTTNRWGNERRLNRAVTIESVE